MENQNELMIKLNEIHRLLIEAYDHYFERDSHGKMGEGVVTLNFPNYWEMKSGKFEPSVQIYSYALGEYRTHYFKTIDDALNCVIGWHQKEMLNSNRGWNVDRTCA